MRGETARQEARKATRAADRAEPMEGYRGPAQPSSTIGQCLNGGYGWLEMPDESKPAARCYPPRERGPLLAKRLDPLDLDQVPGWRPD